MDDLNSLKSRHDKTIEDLKKISDSDFKTKTELVRELIEVSRPLIKAGLIQLFEAQYAIETESYSPLFTNTNRLTQRID